MKRTQIYLDDKTHAFLARESARRKLSMSELIRQNIRLTMKHDTRRMLSRIENAFGAWKDREFETDEYIRNIRKDRKAW